MRQRQNLKWLGCFLILAAAGNAAFASNLTTKTVQAQGADWTYPIWQTNGAGTSVSPVAGNTYTCITDGTGYGNGVNNTRIRNLAAAGVQTFAGDSLTLNTNTELRAKGGTVGLANVILNFPGVGGAPGLILSGGVLDGGDDGTYPVTGGIQVAFPSYIFNGGGGGGGGVSQNRAFNILGVLSGSGSITILDSGTTIPQQITGASNTNFTGQWIIQCGWLQASNSNPLVTNILGTNSITVDPNSTGYLTAMPNVSSPNGPAWFEPCYDLNSAGKLYLTNGGVMVLHQNCCFTAVYVQGAALTAGTHYYAQLAAAYPNNFPAGGSGSLTVQPFGPPPPFPPVITSQPSSVSLPAGSLAQLTASVSGTMPFTYQWQKETNGVFVNATNSGDMSGAQTNTLTFTGLTAVDATNYQLIVTNISGAATSQVATITVAVPVAPIVVTLVPAAGSTVTNFTQLQVIFSENVQGVQADALLIDGSLGQTVSGSGSNYLFTFAQPSPGTVAIDWDPDSGITDLNGDYFNNSTNWSFTLLNTVAPTLVSTQPYPGAIVSQCAEAQVLFSEPVSGVAAADFLINGSPAASVSGNGSGPYLFQFTQPAGGSVQFSWAAGSNIHDAATNLFVTAGTGWAATLDPAAAAAALTNIVINEFLAANVSTNGLEDENGELDDWIEIYNGGTVAVNLDGWVLTDTADLSDTWTFPATNIGAGQYWVVFADGKNIAIPGQNLHTTFALSKGGGYLGLYNADVPPKVAYQYAPSYPQQYNDISYGINSTNGLSYFQVQTPGGPNSTNALSGEANPVNFSVQHGYFSHPFNLYLTATTPGASVFYTTDGSQPSISGGQTNGTLFTGVIPIQHTTVMRAAAFAPGLLPSSVTSESFFFVEDIILQSNNPPGYPTGNAWTPTPGTVVNGSRAYYEMDPTIVNNPQYTNMVRQGLTSIPTISIMTSIDDMFGPTNGLYTHTSDATADSYRGPLWERGCSLELIYPDGSSGGIQLDCGIEIQGGSQRDPAKNPKHSFRLKFTSEYGPGKLNFPLFPGSAVTSFNTLVIDSGINYWWHYVGGSVPLDQRYRAQDVRDQYTADLQQASGHPSFHGRFFHLYLNGLYWGIQYLHERPDDDFAVSYFGGTNSNYDVIKNTTFGLELLDGDLNAWNTALGLSNKGLTNNAQYLQLQQYVDIDNLIDYMIVNHWVGNDDWPQHNWYCVRPRNPSGSYKFIVWDAEHTLKSVTENVTTVNVAGSPAQIYLALTNNAEFRLLYADHLQKLFFNGGLFYTDPNPTNALWDPNHPERNVPASYYMKRINEINTAIVDESARWGGYTLTTNYTRNDHWLLELNNLLGFTNTPGNTANYFPIRTANVLAQYKAIGLFPSVGAPVFNQLGGNVGVGFTVTMGNPNSGGTIYYTTNGTDPRVFGTGGVSPSAMTYFSGSPPVLNSSELVQARVLNGGVWSALASGNFSVASLGIPIRITELMYDPVGGSDYEFIELQNIGNVAVDMSGFSFSGVTYVFPNGTMLAAGAVMVIANNDSPSAWAARYPGVTPAGYYAGHLADSGQLIALLDQNGNTITAVNYNNAAGWPVAAAGGGPSLQVVNPNGDPNDPANWQASPSTNGSPGVVTPVVFTNIVRLNEVMALNSGLVNNGGFYSPWVEVANTGSVNVSLANWSFTDSGNARKFVFPGGTTIAAGGFLVVWCDTNTAAPGLHSGFNISGLGQSLFLYDDSTNLMDAFSYGLQLTNYSIGRAGVSASWQLNQPTPGAANLATNLGTAANNLVINEWMANSVPGGSDWVELYNRSSQPVLLTGLYMANSHDVFEIRSASFIAPSGYVQLFADENVGPDHLDFKIKAAGDTVTLYDYSGAAIDSVSFVNQIQGVSQGRLPDGSANIVSFPGTVSPDAGNYVSAYTGPLLNEVMAKNTTAVYNLGKTPDWIELYNPTGSSFSLAGMSLGSNPYGTGQWTFPAGSTIAANGYLVVWHDSSRPASTNFTSNLNTGYNISADGDNVCLFAATGQLVDSVAFGAQIANLSIGRTGASTWNLLSSPTPGAPNAAVAALGSITNLRINEWLASPASGSDWFELYNAGTLPVCPGGLFLSDNLTLAGLTNTQIPPLTYVAAQGWVEYQADSDANAGANHVNFSLNQDGESIALYNTNLAPVDAVYFGLQSTGVSQGRLPDGGSNIVSFAAPTPDDSNFLPLQNVFVNEVLSRPNAPLEEAVELYNSGPTAVALDGWYVSDNETNFTKYQIPNGTLLAAGGYQVFYQDEFDGGNAAPFTLDPVHGGSVYVSQADNLGNLTGYRALVSFGPADAGVSFGRFPTSAGVDFTAMSSTTFGQDNAATAAQFRAGTGLTNSYPKVGPVIINEIMYNAAASGGSENTANEYIELFNMTSNAVPLYDTSAATNTWELGGDVNYTFSGGVVMPAGSYLVLAGFDPVANPSALAEFTAAYNMAANVPIYGPFTGGPLHHHNGTLQLFKPGPPEVAPAADAGYVPSILVDNVSYSSDAPWPAAAGGGISLQRNYLGLYGDEPLNWVAGAPNPGTRNLLSDTTGGGLPDDWKLAYGLNPYSNTGSNGANGDPDGDGYSNYAEYVLGTNPTNTASRLNFTAAPGPGNAVSVTFSPWLAGRTYQLQATTNLAGGAWVTLTNPVTVNGGNGVFTVTQPNSTNAYYRLSAQIPP